MHDHRPDLPVDRGATDDLPHATLHALSRASVGGDGVPMQPAMQLALDASFQGVERWRASITDCATAPGRGAGWVLLVFQPHAAVLAHLWVADDAPLPAGCVPLLALHGGAAAGAGLDALLDRIDWSAVYARYRQAVEAASEAVGADADNLGDALLLDVRRAGAFAHAPTMIPGARWCDPAAVSAWAAEQPADRDVVVYCVHGHEVSRATALRLRAAGLRARYLRGGIDGWQAAGRPLADKARP